MKSRKLIWQIYPGFLVIILIALIIATIYASGAMRRFYLDRTADGLKDKAMMLGEMLSPSLNPLDAEKIDQLCKNVGRISETRITVILPDGRVIGDSDENSANMDNHGDRTEILEALKKDAAVSVRYSRTLDKIMMYAAVSIKKKTQPIAVIRTAQDISIIEENLAFIRGRFFASGILIALTAAAVALIVTRRISRPLELLCEGVKHFAEGDLKIRLPVPETEELANLAGEMNRMAGQLDEKMQIILRQRNEIEAILASMTEGVIAVDMTERILRINRSGAAMFDRKPQDLKNQNIQEAIRNPQIQRFVRTALAGKEIFEEDVVFFKNGDEMILNTRCAPLYDIDGERMGVLAVFHDVTRLRSLENMRRDFAANVSHEIKTPLTVIRGSAETLMQDSIALPPEASRFAAGIARHARRLSRLIDDLLNLSRIEQQASAREIILESAEIKGIIAAAVRACREICDEKKIAVSMECPDDLQADVNPPLLRQALINLIDNAVKYSPEKSRINISAARKNRHAAIIHVRDEGMGIPASHLPRLFERFYRVDKARSRSLGGTGLGLAIVKHIVQAHGGQIFVQSAPGKGSRFSIHLMLPPDAAI